MTIDDAARGFSDPKAYADEKRFRLSQIEIDGSPSLIETLFVAGPKHLPIRYKVS